MFNSLQKTYKVFQPTKGTNDYGEDVITYEEIAEIRAFIGLTTAGNGFTKGLPQMVMDCNYVGVTTSNEVKPDYRVGDYLVKYVVDAGPNHFFYCQRYE